MCSLRVITPGCTCDCTFDTAGVLCLQTWRLPCSLCSSLVWIATNFEKLNAQSKYFLVAGCGIDFADVESWVGMETANSYGLMMPFVHQNQNENPEEVWDLLMVFVCLFVRQG